MKNRFFKKLTAGFLVAALSLSLSVSVFADSIRTVDGVAYRISEENERVEVYTGWAKSQKGKSYYKKGKVVTKSTVIDGVRYRFSSDGICQGKYTGWTKSSEGKRRYWKDGILVKEEWIRLSDGSYTYAGNDGYLVTGWAETKWGTDGHRKYSHFDENWIWDGQTANELPSESPEEETVMVIEDTSIKRIDEYFDDYFMLDNGVFCANVSRESSWRDHTFTKGDYFGEILSSTEERDLKKIEPWAANVLPVGTKLYYTKERGGAIVAEVDGELILYVEIREG